MKIGQYCQRQRCRHVELEQFWQAFASRGFVSDSWAFLCVLLTYLLTVTCLIVVFLYLLAAHYSDSIIQNENQQHFLYCHSVMEIFPFYVLKPLTK